MCFPMGVVRTNYLANLSWDILDTWPNQHTVVDGISLFGEVA